MSIQDEHNLFLEFALQQGKLSTEAINFCKDQMQQGIEPSVTAVRQKFLTEEQVVEIVRMVKHELNSEESVYLVQLGQEELLLEDPEEKKILEYLNQHNLISPEDLQACLKEQKRLSRQGYQVQLSAILYSSNCLDFETVAGIYREVMGQEIYPVQQAVDASELGLPRIRKVATKKIEPQATEDKETPVKKEPTPREKAMQKIDVALQKLEKRKHRKDKVVAEEVEETESVAQETVSPLEAPTPIQAEQPAEVKQSLEPGAEAVEKTMPIPVALPSASLGQSDVMPILAEILGILKRLDTGTIAPATPSPKPSQPEETTTEEAGKEEESAAAGERVELLRGKIQIKADKALRLLKKGEKLDGYYIQGLSIIDSKIECPVVLTNCLLENWDASGTTFAEDVDFEGTCFIGKAVFKSSVFAKEAQFKKSVFLDGADFTKTQFGADTRFHTAIFKRFVTFNRAQFAKKAIFSHCQFARGAKFNEVEFQGTASFNDLHCDNRFYMNDCTFQDESTFSNADFSDIADFAHTTFTEAVKFKGTLFGKWASFQRVHFKSDCSFYGANVKGDLLFMDAKFGNIIDLQSLCAERNINFKNAELANGAAFRLRDAYFGRLFLTVEQVKDHLESHLESHYKIAREEYGLLKNNFREINEYDHEDWAYLWEKRMARKESPRAKAFLEWLVLDITCGYGTNPVNIFPTLAAVLLFFSGFFFFFGSHFTSPQPLSIMESLQVSFCTMTNLSLGNWVAKQDSWIQYVMMLESFLGFLIMNVVVVITFSRKVIR